MNVTAGSWPGIILWNEIQHRFQIRVNFIYFSSLLSPPRLQISIASSWRRSRDLLFWEGASVAPRRHLKWLFRMRSANYITLYYVDSRLVKTPACKITRINPSGLTNKYCRCGIRYRPVSLCIPACCTIISLLSVPHFGIDLRNRRPDCDWVLDRRSPLIRRVPQRGRVVGPWRTSVCDWSCGVNLKKPLYIYLSGGQ